MKIKKIMLGALAAATIATGIGVSNTPVFAAEQSNVAVTMSLSRNFIEERYIALLLYATGAILLF